MKKLNKKELYNVCGGDSFATGQLAAEVNAGRVIELPEQASSSVPGDDETDIGL